MALSQALHCHHNAVGEAVVCDQKQLSLLLPLHRSEYSPLSSRKIFVFEKLCFRFWTYKSSRMTIVGLRIGSHFTLFHLLPFFYSFLFSFFALGCGVVGRGFSFLLINWLWNKHCPLLDFFSSFPFPLLLLPLAGPARRRIDQPAWICHFPRCRDKIGQIVSRIKLWQLRSILKSRFPIGDNIFYFTVAILCHGCVTMRLQNNSTSSYFIEVKVGKNNWFEFMKVSIYFFLNRFVELLSFVFIKSENLWGRF